MDEASGWLCNTKYLLLMLCGAQRMAQPYVCGKKMLQGGQNCRRGFWILKYIEFWKLWDVEGQFVS
jgi:hypothetical protein